MTKKEYFPKIKFSSICKTLGEIRISTHVLPDVKKAAASEMVNVDLRRLSIMSMKTYAEMSVET